MEPLDDHFFDDDFDELGYDALQELENDAIQSTQANKADPYQPVQHLLVQDFDDDFDDDDLDDTVATDELQGKPIVLPDQPGVAPSSNIIPQQEDGWSSVARPSSHFRPQGAGNDARPPAQVQLGNRPSQGASYSQMRPPPAPLPRPTPTGPSRYQASQAPRHAGSAATDLNSLQAQIQDLKSRLTTKEGEMLMVRGRLDKHRQEHERELQALKKQTAEQLAKQERAVEAARAAERAATTELEFTKQDLKEELDRARRKDIFGTPKKNTSAKTWGVADGFEDVEMVGSPSKGNRGKTTGAVASVVVEPPTRLTRTPTKNKRKRPTTIESPVMALETTEDVIMVDDDEVDGHAENTAGQRIPPGNLTIARKPLSFDFLKVMLSHRSGHGRPLTFDYLSGFALPSRPTESLTSILFQKLATTGDPDDPLQLPIDFCEQVIQLWHQCRTENCLAPISELVSLVSFTLQLNTIGIAPYIVQPLISAAIDSCYEVGIPRHHRTRPGDPEDDSFRNFKDNIPTSDILSTMYLCALGCATSPPIRGALTSPIVDFWSYLQPEFVLMMIQTHKQPVDDFITMLKLLSTSVLDDSIGPISTRRTVDEVAPLILERISAHLIETRQWNVDRDKVRTIRYALLRTLVSFARSKFGMRHLTSHEFVIPRLVLFLSWSIDELYDGIRSSPSYMLPSEDLPSETTPIESAVVFREPDELQGLISHTMLLLHTIVTDKSSNVKVDVMGKLAKFTGGVQKYQLSLARLNFAEEGVSEETAELAHELLELAVTEEQGAELEEFFGVE